MVIRKYLLLYYLIISTLCWPQDQQEDNITKINALQNQIDTYFYSNFDSVYRVCREIVRLSGNEDLLGPRLEAVYAICYCAHYHNRMEEFKSYVLFGNQLLKDKASLLQQIDTTGIHRATMIHATGLYYYTLGYYDDAIGAFSQVITLGGTPLTRDSSVLQSTCSYLGQSWYNLGSLDKSMQYFEMANRYIPRNSEDYNRLHALYYMYQAEHQFSLGLVPEAFISLKNSLHLLEKERDMTFTRSSLISNYNLIAHFYQRTGTYDTAVFFARKALSLHVKNDPGLAGTYRFLGDIFYKDGDLDSALSCYTRSLDLSNKAFRDRHSVKSAALLGIGNVFRDRRLFDKAEAMYRESLYNLMSHEAILHPGNIPSVDLSTLILPTEGTKVLLEHARMFYSWYQDNGNPGYLDSCIIMLDKALLFNDISRRELTNVETKESRGLVQSQITDLGVEVTSRAFHKTGNKSFLRKAVAFMEKSKGNILLDQVNEIRAIKISGIPEPVAEKESRLKGELSVDKNRLLGTKNSDPDYERIKTKYDEKLGEFISMMSEMEQKYPRFTQLKYTTKTIQVEEIQKYLPSNHSLLIQYYAAPDKIYIAGVTKREVILKVAKKDAALDHNVNTLLDQLAKSDIMEVENDSVLFGRFVSSSQQVYASILLPIFNEVKAPFHDLIVIPDGYLCYLPFEILLTGECKQHQVDYSRLPYLLKQYKVRYDYSASLMIGEPDMEQKGGRFYIGYAPVYDNQEALPGTVPGNASLGSLYGNRDEIAACARIWKGISITGKTATEESFRKFAAGGNILHLATHTILDDRDPQNSCFAFSRDIKHPDDGFLFTYELYGMKLPVRLAILSGCETGIGNISKGEGIMSLARAFKFAGCPDIVMSLWKVNDKTTKEIMIRFNENLKKGMKKDKALQLAKISYLNGPKNLHPAFWSSFVLIGNEDPIRNSAKPVTLLITVLCLVLLVTVIKSKSIFSRRR